MAKSILNDMQAAPVFMRTQFNYDHNAASNASGLCCQEPTRTQQHHKEECDINEILRRFGKTGQIPVNVSTALYEDFSNAVDYHTALNAIIAAESEFDTLPSNLRKRFDNDPSKLVYFLQDKKNFDEAVELGLINPPKTEPQAPVLTVTDTPE